MNKLFLIIYDLKVPGRDYNSLYDAIKAISTDYQHPLDSTWFVFTDTDRSSQSIYDELRKTIDDNDNLFIVNMNNPLERQGWMPKNFWTWFAEKVNIL